MCVPFDDYEGSLATLANAARTAIRGFQAETIGILTPCSPGAEEQLLQALPRREGLRKLQPPPLPL